jgi:hypothetical protein
MFRVPAIPGSQRVAGMETEADKLRAELRHYRTLADRTTDRRFRKSIEELIGQCEARLRTIEGAAISPPNSN